MLALLGLLVAPLALAQGGALQGAGTGQGPMAESSDSAASASPASTDPAAAATETGTASGTAPASSASPTSTAPAPTFTATNVVFNSTGASLYSSTTLYTPPASSTTNIFSIVPSGYTSPKAPAPLNNRTNAYKSPKWEEAYSKARSYLSSWSLEEKVQLTTGAGWQIGRCLGNIPAVPNQNYPGLCIQDSPLGVRLADFVSAFPAGINVATTWDKDLMYARGYAMGEEFKGKGANVALGPATNIARAPLAGRNWEGFGADPYLAGWAVEMTVRGLQDAGVQATTKHYVGNEVERWREQSSSNINDRAMREIYTHPFLRGVAAGTASVMASYNLINGSWAAQNEKVLNGILKTDFGFEGYVMSDWQGTHSGVLAANNGLDMTMPGDITFGTLNSYFGNNLSVAVYNGSVSRERLDDMAERIMAGYFLVGQDEGFPEVNFDSFRRLGSNNSHVDVRSDHDVLIRKIGAASTVLLKNVNNTLPLYKPRSILLAGSDMGPSMLGPNGFDDRGGLLGTLAMGWGSGTAEFPYLVDPLQAISLQARKDGSLLDWWFNDEWLDETGLQKHVPYAEVVIVGIAADSGEGYITVEGNNGDRNDYKPWHNGTEVILAAANASSNVVVVVHAAGQIDMEPWIDHPNVTAVLWAGLPGQESGNSLVDVLYGAYNPSAKLPYTIARNTSDYGIEIDYVEAPADGSPFQPQVNYTEDLLVDYRRFQSKGIKPRFEFGFGLSYTSFELADLNVEYIGHGTGGGEGGDGRHPRYGTGKGKNSRSRRQAPAEVSAGNATAAATESASDTASAASSTSAASAGSTTAAPATESASTGSAATLLSTTTTASGSAASDSITPSTSSTASASDTDTPTPSSTSTPEEPTPPAPSQVGHFLSPYLQDPLFRVSVRVTNTGSVYGCEVPQLYISFPSSAGEPPKVLRDFSRVTLDVGQDGWAEWTLNRYDLSIWDVVKQEWTVPEGEMEVVVARSSEDEEELRWGICPSGKGC